MLLDGLAPPEPEPALPPALLAPEDAELDELLDGELLDVVLVVVVEVVEVVDGGGVVATVEVGTVNGGAPDVSAAVVPPLPQPASTAATVSGAQQKASFLITARSPSSGSSLQGPSGSIRLPQCGQSFKSFCACWSHQLQNRRFSTAHGNSEGVGASGSNSPTTCSSSPVSRSM